MMRSLLIVFHLFIFSMPAHAFDLSGFGLGESDLLNERLDQASQVLRVAQHLSLFPMRKRSYLENGSPPG